MGDKKTITIVAFPIMLILIKLYIEMGITTELIMLTIMLSIALKASLVLGALTNMLFTDINKKIGGVAVTISFATLPMILVMLGLSSMPEITTAIFAKRFMIPFTVAYGILFECSYTTVSLYIKEQKIKGGKNGIL